MALEKGEKYVVVKCPDFFTLCDSLKFSQHNDKYPDHPARFWVQAKKGYKDDQVASIVVKSLRMVGLTLIEVMGVEIELGGFYKNRVRIVFDLEKLETGVPVLEIL